MRDRAAEPPTRQASAESTGCRAAGEGQPDYLCDSRSPKGRKHVAGFRRNKAAGLNEPLGSARDGERVTC